MNNFVTYQSFSFFSFKFLLSNHLFYIVVFHVFLLFLESNDLCILGAFILESLCLSHLFHLLVGILHLNSLSSCLFLSEISLQASLLIGFSHSSEAILALSILFVSLTDLHCLLGSAFGFFDLFPGFFLFKL